MADVGATDSYTGWGTISCVAMLAADPKPSFVERLFAEHRADQTAIRNPVHYLYAVANNLVKEHGALEHRQANSVDIDEAPPHSQLETLPAFDGDLDATQRVARLGVVLRQLRPKCRAAVELRFTHGLSYREIALHLGISPQMAKKYVAQALGHCRRRMARLG